jgi:hypothetical protein
MTLSLVAPDGKVYDAGTTGVASGGDTTSQWLEIANPPAGVWKVRVFGDEVEENGESAQISAYADTVAPGPPSVQADSASIAGQPETFELTATGPGDAIYNWTFSDGAAATGAKVRHTFANEGDLWATVQVTSVSGESTWFSTNVGTSQTDHSPPSIGGIPGTQTLKTTGVGGALATYELPVATDDVDGSVPVKCIPASGSTFPVGTTTVKCTATDQAGNIATASFEIKVADTTPPVITVPPNETTQATGATGALVEYTATAKDAVDGPVPVTCAPGSGSTFPIGATNVECTAIDHAGNGATATFQITVDDKTPPVIAAPGDRTAEASGPAGTAVAYTTMAEDAVSGAVPVICVPASRSMFPLGATSVSCSATDPAGNIATATFRVTVLDTTSPVIVVPVSKTVHASNSAGAAVTYDASANDTVDGPVSVRCSPASGSIFPPGMTSVRCAASDKADNAATATFKITVVRASAHDELRTLLHGVHAAKLTSRHRIWRRLQSRLLRELGAAERDLGRRHARPACPPLAMFTSVVAANTVPAGVISKLLSTEWIADAEQVQGLLGCPAGRASKTVRISPRGSSGAG